MIEPKKRAKKDGFLEISRESRGRISASEGGCWQACYHNIYICEETGRWYRTVTGNEEYCDPGHGQQLRPSLKLIDLALSTCDLPAKIASKLRERKTALLARKSCVWVLSNEGWSPECSGKTTLDTPGGFCSWCGKPRMTIRITELKKCKCGSHARYTYSTCKACARRSK